jgi:hypothetical protein
MMRKVRFRIGLYQSGPFEGSNRSNNWKYLRFYSDGTVLSVSSSGKPNQIAKWFKKPYANTGLHQIEGSAIQFSTASWLGTFEFQGQIQGAGPLQKLDVVSHINLHRSHVAYHLVQPGKGGCTNFCLSSTPLV